VKRSHVSILIVALVTFGLAFIGCSGDDELSDTEVEATLNARVQATVDSMQAADDDAAIVEEAADDFVEIEETEEQIEPEPSPTYTIPPTSTATMTPTSIPTNTPIPRNQIVLATDIVNDTTKVSGLAFSNAIDLEVVRADSNEQHELMQQPNVASVIYAPTDRPEAETLINLDTFVREGGTVFIFYSDFWAYQNDILQDFYGVSVADEEVITEPDVLLYKSELLPGWMGGLRVGIPSEDNTLRLDSYLVVPGEIGEAGTIQSSESGRERLVYYANPQQNTTFFPVILERSCSSFECNNRNRLFFDDDYIDFVDNEVAMLAIFDYLVSNQ
jgi:hypothetical protein